VVRARFLVSDGVPDLYIVTNARPEDTELRDLVNAICLTDGLLKYCIDVEKQAAAVSLDFRLPRPLGVRSVAKIALLWAFGHELFHYLRRHALVEKHFGGDAATKHALEFDADMCAVASIYRLVQRRPAVGNAFQMKRAVLANIFWPMRVEIDRKFVDFEGTETHPHPAVRLLDAVGKLAMLHDSGPPDPGFANPMTVLHFHKLIEFCCRLELARFKVPQGGAILQDIQSTFRDFAMANSNLRYTSHRHMRWDEISPFIDNFSLLSRSVVDNEKSIAILGDKISLPRR
jgi:hypothetical protein